MNYGTNSVTLTWDAASENIPGALLRYRIYRITGLSAFNANVSNSTSWNNVGDTIGTALIYQDTVPNLVGNTYFYKVIGIYDEGGGETESDFASAHYRHTAMAPDISISAYDYASPNHSVTLTWNDVIDPTSSLSFIDYFLYYSTDGVNFNFESQVTSSVGISTYIHNLTGTALYTDVYYYRVYTTAGSQLRTNADYGYITTPVVGIAGTETSTTIPATWTAVNDPNSLLASYMLLFTSATSLVGVTPVILDPTPKTSHNFTPPAPKSNEIYLSYATGTSFTYEGLSSSTTYYLFIHTVTYKYSNATYTVDEFGDYQNGGTRPQNGSTLPDPLDLPLTEYAEFQTLTGGGGGGSDPYVKSMFGKIIKLPNIAKKWVLFNDEKTGYSIVAHSTNYRQGNFFNFMEITNGDNKVMVDFSKHQVKSAKQWYKMETMRETFKYATVKDGYKIHEETEEFDTIVFNHPTFEQVKILINWRNHYIHPYYKKFPKENSFKGLLMMRKN
jgi:hypothetical protein